MHRTRNAAYGQPYRGFESLPLRQFHPQYIDMAQTIFTRGYLPTNLPTPFKWCRNYSPRPEFEWNTIQPLLPNKPRGVPRVDDRRVLNGIFWILRSGSPWADLPERYGPPTTVYNRFNRWRKAGIWDKLMDAIIEAQDGKVQMIDSSVVRVHQQAAAQKNRLETLVSVEVVED
jgi:transposase